VSFVPVVDQIDQDVTGLNRNVHLNPHKLTPRTPVLNDVGLTQHIKTPII
jgi:hypothetical protein